MKKISRIPNRTPRRRGFTLMQLMVVIAMIATLATILMGAFGRTRAGAKRVQCDMRIKAITMALDAFRQENGRYPDTLQQLVDKKYLTDTTMLRCPSDPRPATDPNNKGYNDFYVIRSNRDSDELPIITCPLCENEGQQGIQAFKGRYTKQFATRPAELVSATGAIVDRPGKTSIAAKAGMLLRGGDSIRTVSGGAAVLRFADDSTTEVGSASEITVLQSFIIGHSQAPLYTMIRQKAGDVLYKVHHGSKFDVATPTATAGALGTQFRITEDVNHDWWLTVIESRVYVSDTESSDIFLPGDTTDLETGTSGDTVFVGPSTITSNDQAGTTKKKKRKTRKHRNRS